MKHGIYNQQLLTISVDGARLTDLADQNAVSVTTEGGVVALTQGADGPSVNRSTKQGGTIVVTLREDSRSLQFLDGLFNRQYAGGGGVSVVVRTGTEIIFELRNAHLSQPGQLQTGGPTMGSFAYTFIGTEMKMSNLSGGMSGLTGGFF